MFDKTIIKILSIMKQGKLNSVDLCEMCIKRMEKLSDLNMFITKTPDLARQMAIKSDENFKNGNIGLLEGIPIAVKDNFSTTGILTTCASKMLQNYVPPYNATVVEKLFKNGAILMGKTNMDEFAMGSGSIDGAYGPVRNPWVGKSTKNKLYSKTSQNFNGQFEANENYTNNELQSDASVKVDDFNVAGGSSGGSTVAVTTGVAFAALGSDTGGSTRNPASYCGVVGLKPTYGLLSRHGLIPLVNSMDVPGILTRNVQNSVLVLNLLAGFDNRDSTMVRKKYAPINVPLEPNIEGLTIGIPKEYRTQNLSSDTVEIWDKAANNLANSGARVIECSLPHTLLSIAAYYVLCTTEVASNMARYDSLQYGHRPSIEGSTDGLFSAARKEAFNEVVRSRILAGNYFLLKSNYEKYYIRAQKVRRLICEDFRKVFSSSIDVLLTPTVLGDAPRYRQFSCTNNQSMTQEQDIFTQPANMAGIPAISIPHAFSSNQLPIGLQLMAPPFREDILLNVAMFLQNMAEFPAWDINKYRKQCDEKVKKV